MLDGMRKASQNWFGRLVMGLVMAFISLSFLVWGVGDIFRDIGTNKIAKVGSTDISAEAFRTAYQTQLQTLQRQLRRAITNDQARNAGLDSQVLSRLITEAVLDDHANKLNLAISNQDIAKAILTDPGFAGPSGKFDPLRFQDILRDNGLNEQGFVREQRKVYLRQEIVDSVAGELPLPKAALAAVSRYRTEARTLVYFVLPTSAAGKIDAPAADVLAAYFDARKTGFRTPELRKLIVLSLSPAQLADPASVSDTDVRARYEKVKGERFGSTESRELEQIVFPTEAAAQEASAKIKAGTSFADVAEASKLSIVKLGKVERAKLADRAVADAAFALPLNAVSAPIAGQFGSILVHVTAITPGVTKPIAEVSDELKREIATERARDKVVLAHDKIEDERTSGKALTEAATAAGFTVRTIESIDATGHDKAGKDVADLNDRDALLRAAFASDIGVDNETLNTRDGGSVWFEVAGVDRARDQTLDEVKDLVTANWRDDEIAKRLADKGAELVKKINAGEKMIDLAKANGDLKMQRAEHIKRVDEATLDPAFVTQAFSVGVGKAASVAGAGNTRTVFRVIDSVVPAMDAGSDVLKNVETQLKQQFAEDLLAQYLTKLQADLGVTVNQAAFRIAVGGGSEQN